MRLPTKGSRRASSRWQAATKKFTMRSCLCQVLMFTCHMPIRPNPQTCPLHDVARHPLRRAQHLSKRKTHQKVRAPTHRKSSAERGFSKGERAISMYFPLVVSPPALRVIEGSNHERGDLHPSTGSAIRPGSPCAVILPPARPSVPTLTLSLPSGRPNSDTGSLDALLGFPWTPV